METKSPGLLKRSALLAGRAVADEAASLSVALKTGGFLKWCVAFVLRQFWAWAILGSLVLGLTLPVLLVIWNMGGEISGAAQPGQSKLLAGLSESAVLLGLALIFCGPLAILFALGVYAVLRQRADEPDAVLSSIAKRGAILGGVVAFLNLPGYLAGALMHKNEELLWLQLPLLFVVAGVSCGFWIAWQAWRATRPKEPLLPRYSLSWLFMLMISWALVMAVFAPKT